MHKMIDLRDEPLPEAGVSGYDYAVEMMHKLSRKLGLNDFEAFHFVDCTALRAPKFEHGEPRHLGTAKKSQSGMFDANENLEDVCVEIVRKVQGIALK